MSKRAVFIDRDGVLNEMVYDDVHGLLDSPRRPEQVRAIPGAAAFLEGVAALGYQRIVVTNQPGIAKGTLTEDELVRVNEALAAQLADEGPAWDDLRYSPYHPSGGPWARPEYVRESACRKPGPGMLLAAAEERDLDLGASWMVGDGLVDIQAGHAAGCRTILVARLKIETIARFLDLDGAEPDVVVSNLAAALEVIRNGR